MSCFSTNKLAVMALIHSTCLKIRLDLQSKVLTLSLRYCFAFSLKEAKNAQIKYIKEIIC